MSREIVQVHDGIATIRDYVVFERDGEIVGRVHASFDLHELPQDLWQALPTPRIYFVVSGIERMRLAQEIVTRKLNLTGRLKKWRSLPWWRKLWTRRPSLWDDETLSGDP